MKKEYNEIEIAANQPAKSEWNTPEIEVFSVKDKTLDLGATNPDGVTFSS